MGILNYSTTVPANKSANEVIGILAKHGATTVASFYDNGEPSGIAFTISTPFGLRDFKLPANTAGVYTAISAYGSGVAPRYQSKDQAKRIAWRILKDWIEVQIALIESGMSTLDEVMLPYMVQGVEGQTVAQIYRHEQGRLMIEAAS